MPALLKPERIVSEFEIFPDTPQYLDRTADPACACPCAPFLQRASYVGVTIVRHTLAAGLAAFVFGAGSAFAATVPGENNVTTNPDGSLSFVFDEPVQTDIVGTGMGLFFDSGTGLTFTVTGSGIVRQDSSPSNGGLGVDGGPNGDNLEDGEWLTITFNQTVDIYGFLLNGLIGQSGHQDAANGNLDVTTSKGTFASVVPQSFDGIGDPATASNLCGAGLIQFCGVTFITFTPGDFSLNTLAFEGYIEGITVAVVPLPASLGFLAAGLAGLGIVGRKRRKA